MVEQGDTRNKDWSGSSSRVWDKQAAFYDLLRIGDPIYNSCIRQVVVNVPNHTTICLDAGCGTGISTQAIKSRSKLVIAVDYSKESLCILKKKYNDIIIQADINMLPFRNSIFDVAVCANTLQHIRPGKYQEQIIAELRRVTKDKGLVIVSVHHYSKGKIRAGWIKEGKPGQKEIDYIFRFSLSDLKKLMPTSFIRAVGYYSLFKIPFLGCYIQNILAFLLGGYFAKLGYGHMLIAVEKIHKS